MRTDCIALLGSVLRVPWKAALAKSIDAPVRPCSLKAAVEGYIIGCGGGIWPVSPAVLTLHTRSTAVGGPLSYHNDLLLCGSPLNAWSHGRFSEVHACIFLPDPGALNSCMHTFPKKNVGFTVVQHIITCIWIWELKPSICNFAN